MTWGAPPTVETPVTSVGASELGWLFYEFNGIAATAGNNFVTKTQMTDAIANFGKISYQNYVAGNHNIWNYLEIGGRDLTASSNNQQPIQMAATFTPIMYNYISSGQRMAAPWGLIMMNFADKDSNTSTYGYSYNLIRAIAANNRLFPLQRKAAAGESPTPTSVTNGGNIVSRTEWDRF